ncbi:glycerol-3-phosphate 1-O-acyltransferase PlsY [Candidatus Schneideria nysicola]|uniref:glycerol-3-phosphate 1-O-acyltransferase PlsY n=1 Tax=Candidatus Schneideria nysicola TaxID=1081631 RepID=UPI001CAA777B|nr:glycerol-3-phosphate 1-O-acyltransferase PlsY [Candidatus Schneideria nysicola]UAJ65645.1 glycerol-3-phosphate 1-O-acyltransferase PlsY [Candidatus Schneideria nysicola]UAJ66173.1 glycerol-3-phosphate 1-O-acyltransferase PlsY [Candidatus Schneideria nysicola]
MNSIMIVGLIVFAYLIGSISNSILICKIAKLPDLRKQGSYNPGSTNMLRLHGKILSLFVAILDIFKGIFPVLLGKLLCDDISLFYLGLITVSTCIGHIYPIFFHFKGGKGVAPVLGGMMVINPILSILMIVTWIVIVLIFGYSSLGSIIAILIGLIYSFFQQEIIIPVIILAFLIIFRHYENIRRLLNGKEDNILQYLIKKNQDK